jgi:predicted lipid-binding transport protein (Tim44 family)
MFMGNSKKFGIVLSVFTLFSLCAFDIDAYARAGFGRSFGSRGSRSLYSPRQPYSSPYSQHRPSAPYNTPTSPKTNPMMPQQTGNSFMRGLAGGMVGGLIGNMLFGGLSHGMGWGGGIGGSGIGLMDMLLIGGLLYGVFWFFKRKSLQPGSYYETGADQYREQQSSDYQDTYQRNAELENNENLRLIRLSDPHFDENSFKDRCMDSFFKIQAAWINRDMNSVRAILTEEMFSIMETDVAKLKSDGMINKLDNIAVRSVDMTEVWREGIIDFITVKFIANLLDYTVNDVTGELVSGSKTEPVKFVEYWTFSRSTGDDAWSLSAINQVE